MKVVHFISCFILAFTAALMAEAQDAHYSLPTEAPLTINPAYTGSFTGLARAGAAYRNQWSSIGKGAVSYNVYADFRIPTPKRDKEHVQALGVLIQQDRKGDLGFGNFHFGVSYALRMKLSRRETLSFGAQACYTQSSIKDDHLQWGSQYNGTAFDPTLGGERLAYIPTSYADVAAGISYEKGIGNKTITSEDERWSRIGLSVYHLTTPNHNSWPQNEDPIEMRYVLQGQFHIGFENTNIALEPSFLGMMQGPAIEAAAGTFVMFEMQQSSRFTGYVDSEHIGFGFFYRWMDAAIPAFMYTSDRYRVSLSYDITVSKLNRSNGMAGGPEINFRFILPDM
jgi:type IX secretion system PorP/SprF family membrane protein